MKSMNLIQTTAIPSSFGMPTRGHRSVLETGVVANGAARGYADWVTDTWSPSHC